MAGRSKKIVESTKQEVSTDIEDIAVDEAIAKLKKMNYLEKNSSYITDATEIDNVGVIFNTRFFDKDDKFINGNTIYIPGIKVLVIENEDGSIDKKLVHINA